MGRAGCVTDTEVTKIPTKLYSKKKKQGTFNVTLWRVAVTFFAVQKQQCILYVFWRDMSLSTK